MITWLTLPELAAYSKLSTRTLKRAAARSSNRLPSHLVEGRRLFTQTEYDRWAMGRAEKIKKAVAQVGCAGGARDVSSYGTTCP